MSIITHIDRDNRLRVLFNDEHTTHAERYTICFEGRDTVVIAKLWDSPAAAWQRVLELVADMRAVIRRGAWRGREHYFATVYAGIQPTEHQGAAHMQDWISFCLYQLSDPPHNKDGESRVDALIALSNLHGLVTPCRWRVPTVREIDAELANRKVRGVLDYRRQSKTD
jgi:hypothetical protein